MVTDNTKTHIDPLDYFDPNAPVPEQPLSSKYSFAFFIPMAIVVSICGFNYYSKKPAWTGIYRHFLGAGFGIITGLYLERVIQRLNARRDDMLYNYIKTHPQDFPVVERVKYKDVLEKWEPVR